MAARQGRSNVVPVERITASEVVATVIAEIDLQRVRLRGLAVTFEFFEVFELRVRAKAALDCLDGLTREVSLRSLEEQPIPRLE
jgi:hypothetical protein